MVWILIIQRHLPNTNFPTSWLSVQFVLFCEGSQESVCLVGKSFARPLRVFCTTLQPYLPAAMLQTHKRNSNIVSAQNFSEVCECTKFNTFECDWIRMGLNGIGGETPTLHGLHTQMFLFTKRLYVIPWASCSFGVLYGTAVFLNRIGFNGFGWAAPGLSPRHWSQKHQQYLG